MTIYEIDHAIAEAFEKAVDPETGEIVDSEAWAELESLQMDRDAKVEGVALWVKDLNAEAAAIKAEEENLKKRRQQSERKADSLKRYLGWTLDGEKFKTAKVAISWRRSETVELDPEMDPAKLPLEFQKIKVDVSPDKTALKEALKKGLTVEGVQIVEHQNLQIK
jgi:hypothetical protein